jgi:8-oxo-dGTP pyrophosphatase MutT (NUDIX family)
MILADAPAYWGKVKLSDPDEHTKILFHSKWLELRSTNNYIFIHDPWCNSVGVGILPWRRKVDGNLEFLVVKEHRPCHVQEGFYAITGGYDDRALTILQCVLKELKEEGGYVVPNNRVRSLGAINATRSSDVVMHLFTTEITTDTELVQPTGDGTALEETMIPVWVTANDIVNSSDTFLLALYLRFLKSN